ncbi:MAG: hypothetical protein JXA99_13700 [Candidatus Lokiarchaeota archaeon]|nr:hypothetical protein [Candidatus Lokiarchaeota archaeon]
MNEQYSNYSKTQVNAAKGFYIAIVISLIIIIAGTVWWVADLINPSGKLSTFIDLNIFYQIVIVAGFLAGFFFLLVIFIGISKRGTKSLLHVFFNKIEIEEQLKNKIHIKLAAGGFLICVIAIFVSIILAVIYDIVDGAGATSTSIIEYLSNISVGLLILSSGIGLLICIAICLFIIYFLKNGYYLILKIFGGLNK